MASFVFFGCSLVAPAAHAKSTKLRRSWRGAFAVRYCPASLRAEDGETPAVEPSLYIGYPFAKFGHLATERRNIGSQRSEIAAQRSEIAVQCRNAFVRGRTRRRNAFVRRCTRRRNAFVRRCTQCRNAFVRGRPRRLESLVHVHAQHCDFPARSYASFHDQRSQRNSDSKYGPQLRLHRSVPPRRARQPLSGASRSLKLHLSAPPQAATYRIAEIDPEYLRLASAAAACRSLRLASTRRRLPLPTELGNLSNENGLGISLAIRKANGSFLSAPRPRRSHASERLFRSLASSTNPSGRNRVRSRPSDDSRSARSEKRKNKTDRNGDAERAAARMANAIP